MFDPTNRTHLMTLASYLSPADRSDEAVATALNFVREEAAFRVGKGEVSRDVFITEWADVFEAVRTHLDLTIYAKWLWRIEHMLMPKEAVTVSGPAFAGFVTELIADGLLTAAQADSKTTRQGSTAETLFGPGTLLTAHDIWLARLEGTT